MMRLTGKRTRGRLSGAVFAALVLTLLLAGCPKQPEESAMGEVQPPADSQSLSSQAGDTGVQTGAGESAERTGAGAKGLEAIYFDFDQAGIRDDARPIMRANAEWLKANPQARIRIEGNCDERGTIEYNQALGQRRAQGAKNYLSTLGIPGSRIMLISYGKDKPVCQTHDDDCWQQNRRADFVVINR